MGRTVPTCTFVGQANRAGLKPIADIAAFGGAQISHENEAHGIGGTQLLGLVPLNKVIGAAIIILAILVLFFTTPAQPSITLWVLLTLV